MPFYACVCLYAYGKPGFELPIASLTRSGSHWFPHEMTSEKRAQKCHNDDAVTSQIWVKLQIGRGEIGFSQSEALPRSGQWHVISMEFLQSFPRRHFAGKPVVVSRNVGCFLRQEWWSMSGSVIDAQTTDKTRKTISFQLRSYLGLPYLLFVLLIKVFSSFCLTYEVSDSASSSSTQWTYALL